MKLKFNNKLIRTQGGSILTFKGIEPTTINYGLLYNWWATQPQTGGVSIINPDMTWIEDPTNNIAPAGFRVPSESEWEEERLSWASNNAAGAFGSVLKLSMGGDRDNTDGIIYTIGYTGSYWSSSIMGVSTRNIYIHSNGAGMNNTSRAAGYSIRLIKDENYTGTPFTGGDFNGFFYDLVTSPTGRVWLDRNLGATQVATSSTDSASYGWLYQWGRGSDGHQLRNSSTTATLSNTDTPAHGNFITTSASPHDWRSPQNNNLWQVIGFGISSDVNWTTLTNYVQSEITAGRLPNIGVGCILKSARTEIGVPPVGISTNDHPRWIYNETYYGRNNVSFNALPSGYRSLNDGFDILGGIGFFITSTDSGENIWYRVLDHDWNEVFRYNTASKKTGMPIRTTRVATASEQALPDGLIEAYYTGNDGKIYRCCKIGTQVWVSDNLSETKWSNGQYIQGWDINGRVIISNIDWSNLTTAAVCVYNNDMNNM